MGEIDIRQQQEYALGALKELDEILSSNGIEYLLVAGSCLGAIRHNGFIPWDDDIDIGVFQEDYEKVALLLQNNLSEQYSWIDVDLGNCYPRFHGKLLRRGAGCIDVFPLIRTSNKNLMRRMQWIIRKISFKLYKAKIAYANKNETGKFADRIKVGLSRFVALFVSIESVMKLKTWNERLYQGKNSNYYINMYSIYSMQRELIKFEWIFPIQRHTFEEYEFPVMNDANDYLKHLYGDDYMIPQQYKDCQHEETF